MLSLYSIYLLPERENLHVVFSWAYLKNLFTFHIWHSLSYLIYMLTYYKTKAMLNNTRKKYHDRCSANITIRVWRIAILFIFTFAFRYRSLDKGWISSNIWINIAIHFNIIGFYEWKDKIEHHCNRNCIGHCSSDWFHSSGTCINKLFQLYNKNS